MKILRMTLSFFALGFTGFTSLVVGVAGVGVVLALAETVRLPGVLGSVVVFSFDMINQPPG